MHEFLDEHFLYVVTSLSGFFRHYYGSLVGVGKAFGAVLSLVVVASEAYQMMLLKKSIDILSLLRPILICFVLAFWGSFTTGLRQPFDGIENWARKGVYQTEVNKVNQLHKKRWEVQLKQYQILQDARAKAEVAEDQVKENKNALMEAWDNIKEFSKKLLDISKVIFDLKNTFFNWILEHIVNFIASIIWHICVLLTFFGKEIGLGILTITGPISFGISVLPVWKDAWASWVARYLSFCLYGFVAYLIMAAAMQLFKYGIEVDIQRLSTPGVPNPYNFNGLYSIVGAVVGGYGLRMTPEIVSWIFPTNTSMAISNFIGGMQNAVKQTAGTAAKAAAGAV